PTRFRSSCVQRRRAGLQARKQRDRNARDSAPDIRCDDRRPRIRSITEEIDAVVDQPPFHEHPGDDRELCVIDPPEGDRRQHCGHDPRQEDDRAEESLERQVIIENERQPQAQRELQNGGNDRIKERVENGEPEDGVFPKQLVIVEADENAFPAYARIRERQPYAEPERIRQKDQKKGRGWQEKKQSPQISALAQVYSEPASGYF